jgi:iron complex outermembrane receptor protein
VVYNSAFNENNSSAMIGINRKWGYQHFHLSSYNAQFGMIEGARDTNGLFVNHDGVSITNDNALTRTIDLPFQRVTHYKISTLGSYFIGHGNLRTIFGWQDNQRKEYEESAFHPGMAIDLHTITGDVKYYFPEIKNIEIVAGTSSSYQFNTNKGVDYLIPNYTANDFGLFASIKKTKNKWSRNFGLRYDWRTIKVDSLASLFTSFNKNYNAFSGSAGFTYEASDYLHFRMNAGRGFRVPNISELSANGVHEGTYRYEIGNPELKPETSWQFDIGAGYESEKVGGEVALFYNLFNQFIYYRTSGNEMQAVNNTLYPVFRYVQGNATFYGGEISIDYHLNKQLHFENKLSVVSATNNETQLPIPFIPPFHFNSSISYEFIKINDSKWKSLKLNMQVDYFAKQNRIDQFETVTADYTLMGAGMSFRYEAKHFSFNLFFMCNNITDVVYYNHLSRLKYINVAGMGRNFTIGCSIPFDVFKRQSP